MDQNAYLDCAIQPTKRSASMHESGTVTRLLRQVRDGDAAAMDDLIPLLYDELHEIAQQRLYKERKGHTLGATALVNELYLRLIDSKQLDLADRNEFMALASNAMRNILVDHARSRKRAKRGGGQRHVPLEKVEFFLSDDESAELIVLDEALERLMSGDERAGLVVQYRFFGGLTLDETAAVMGLSKRSVQRSWTMARAWLRKEIGDLPSA